MKTVTAIITARGGSKGIVGKNIREVCGKPLIAYTIDAALNCSLVGRTVVTTDDDTIRDISLSLGAEVIDRPEYLAADDALSKDAVLHALQVLQDQEAKPESFVLLQPTSPLRSAGHLQQCLELFYTSGVDCISSVTEAEHHPMKMLISEKGTLIPIIDAQTLESPRQLLPAAYRVNGAIYVMKTERFMREMTFFAEPYLPYIMSAEDSLDIDSENDLLALEKILNERRIL